MRINKEVRTLSKEFDIIYLGVGKRENAFLGTYCKKLVMIDGRRNQPFTLLRQIVKSIQILSSNKISSLHIINEQLMIFFYPICFLKYTVLDVFDSIFLRRNYGKNDLSFLKYILYYPVNGILVTDDNRKSLMPGFSQEKTIVLPNYPQSFPTNFKFRTPDKTKPLTIIFFGWLGLKRGGSIIEGLVNSCPEVRVIMLGWFSDEETKKLVEHPSIEYRGVVPQKEALETAAIEADYIMCAYEPIHSNNVNASPNKIYDGIQTRTPLIINREIKVSSLIEKLNIGVVLDSYYPENFVMIFKQLRSAQGTFSFSSALAEKYTWNNVEERILEIHRQ